MVLVVLVEHAQSPLCHSWHLYALINQWPYLVGHNNEACKVSLIWSTGNVAVDRYLIPTMNTNFRIQIGGPEKGQYSMGAEASSAYNRRGASILQPLSSLLLKPQVGQELPHRSVDLDTSVGDVFLSTGVCQDEGQMQACAQLSVDAGDSSLVWSGSQLTHRVSPESPTTNSMFCYDSSNRPRSEECLCADFPSFQIFAVSRKFYQKFLQIWTMVKIEAIFI